MGFADAVSSASKRGLKKAKKRFKKAKPLGPSLTKAHPAKKKTAASPAKKAKGFIERQRTHFSNLKEAKSSPVGPATKPTETKATQAQTKKLGQALEAKKKATVSREKASRDKREKASGFKKRPRKN
ncbi:unnamed protein product [marine sediment metagenome]|uniref:Uncharacterized protein n=1 Tax=marine sediment metagenome TaxID=412755 RepID=X1CWZ3_9ZZZZ